MRKVTLAMALLVVSSVVMAFTNYNGMLRPVAKKVAELPIASEIETIDMETITPELPEIKIKDHSLFLNDIGHRESTNNYKAVNQFGYLGKYQFGRATLNALGYDEISNREFLANPSIQEEAMYALLIHNKKILRRQIEKYHGTTVNGIYITESGILAAAHLAGPGNVKKFFRKGYEFHDGNGTKMTSYMVMFSDYKLEF